MGSFSDYYNVYKGVTSNPDKPVSNIQKPKRDYNSYHNPGIVQISKNNISNNVKLFKSDNAAQNKKCVVVIPVYRNPDNFEKVNLLKTVSVFRETHTIVLVCPDNFSTAAYNEIYGYDFAVTRFPRKYFRSKETYSEMLLSVGFYKTFSSWEYMLIVQPDVFIFGNVLELEQFYGYAYLGAPYDKNYVKNAFGYDCEMVGNGGFSLRNIRTMTEILGEEYPEFSKYGGVEDQFISNVLHKKNMLAPVDLARKFSIDNNPEYWFERNSNELPFGVHMAKPEFRSFWKQHIIEDFNIIVSLTSFGDRLVNDAPVVIQNFINNQILQPKMILLVIEKKDINRCPKYFIDLEKKGSMLIMSSDCDYRPHLKYFYAMLHFKKENIVTIDDDQNYNGDLLFNLFKQHLNYPDCVVANRCHRMKYGLNGVLLEYENWEYETNYCTTPDDMLFATGVGGVLYPADILHIQKSDGDRINEFITTDDILLKQFEIERNVKVVGLPKRDIAHLHQRMTRTALKIKLCDQNTKHEKINDVNLKKTSFYIRDCNMGGGYQQNLLYGDKRAV